jgi:hypothetical protein
MHVNLRVHKHVSLLHVNLLLHLLGALGTMVHVHLHAHFRSGGDGERPRQSIVGGAEHDDRGLSRA